MNRHTPGPWVVYVDTLDKGWATPEQNITISSGDVIVASYSTGYSEYPDDSVNEANAQLIAAAPELLAACRLLVADDLTGDQLANRIAYGRAAIAKATGEQP